MELVTVNYLDARLADFRKSLDQDLFAINRYIEKVDKRTARMERKIDKALETLEKYNQSRA